MNGIVLVGFLAALYLVPTAILVGAAVLARRSLSRRNRRNPLTNNLLRGPGHSLQAEREDIRADMVAHLAAGTPLPLMLFTAWSMQQMNDGKTSTLASSILVIGGIGILTYLAVKVNRLVHRAHRISLGIDAEIAVGQELNQLLKHGFDVFHDVSAEGKFNIDHVVVGPTGVFAVETKGRPKLVKDNEKQYRVRVNGDRLEFPGWSETRPMRQARQNAEWLGKWLTAATGEPVTAKPVLMLPGWYIENSGTSDVKIGNGKNCLRLFKDPRPCLTEAQVRRIVHQLDARCRDVAPRAYSSDLKRPSESNH